MNPSSSPPPERTTGPQGGDIIIGGFCMNRPETMAAYAAWKRGEGPKPDPDPRMSGPAPTRNPVPPESAPPAARPVLKLKPQH